MKELTKIGLIHTDCLTVTGPLKDRLAHAFVENHEVIHDIDNAYMNKGGIAILKGNLAPLGSVIKESAVEKELLTYEGTAKCYDSEEAAIKAITGGEIKEGHVVVIRYEGPKGGPGMREMLNPTAVITGMGLKVALLTDGRFSRSQPRCLRRPHFPGSHGRRSPLPLSKMGTGSSSTFRIADSSCWLMRRNLQEEKPLGKDRNQKSRRVTYPAMPALLQAPIRALS